MDFMAGPLSTMKTYQPTILVAPLGPHAAALFLTEAVRCGSCGRMAMIVVNRDGKTTCVDCDRAK